MIILGIDPGIATTGWGVVEKDNRGKIVMKDYGCVITEPKTPFSERLSQLYAGIASILREYNPDAFVVEELFFNKNVTTALIVGQARGVILLAAEHFKQNYFEYTPLQVKQAMTGYGRADKKQMQQMVKMLLALKEIPKPDDAADALAIAYTHGVMAR